MDFIFIEGMLVTAHVGIYPRERSAPQQLDISMTFGMPDNAGQHDDIADTISYDQVVARIRDILEAQQFNLLEALAEFLANLMHEEFKVAWVRLSIAKPAILRDVQRIGVAIERRFDGGKMPLPNNF